VRSGAVAEIAGEQYPALVSDGEGGRFDLRRRHGLRSTHAHQPVSAVGAPQGRVAERTADWKRRRCFHNWCLINL
jgi:hypothetical protein